MNLILYHFDATATSLTWENKRFVLKLSRIKRSLVFYRTDVQENMKDHREGILFIQVAGLKITIVLNKGHNQ